MYFTYILQSRKDKRNYSGYTKDLDLRVKQHQQGEAEWTKHGRPLAPIYYEACLNARDAKRREKYFKTQYGRMVIKKGLKDGIQTVHNWTNTTIWLSASPKVRFIKPLTGHSWDVVCN